MNKFYQLHNKSLQKHKVENIKELWDKLKKKGYAGMSVQVKTTFTKAEDSIDSYHAVFSTASVDRHGDIVEQNWVTKNFKNNPVYLDSHDYSSIDKIIGKVSNLKSKDVLEGDIIFATQNPRGQLAKDLVDGGFLNTSSVGFIPKEFDEKFERIIKSELLEISAVSVPANPEALYGKSKSITENEGGDNKEIKDASDGEDKREESDEAGKTEEEVIEDIKETANEKILKALNGELDKKTKALNKILGAIKFVSENVKVETRQNGVRAENNNLINTAIRKLIKLKD